MKSNVILIALVSCLMLTTVASAQEAQMVDNPDYLHWSQFQPGSFATIAGKTTMGDGQMSMVLESQRTATLISISDDEAVVEQTVVTTMPGMTMPPQVQRQSIAAKVPAGQESDMLDPENKISEGEEQLEIAGQTYDTKWVEYKMTEQGVSMTAKSWFVDGIPGRQIKMTAKGEGQIAFQSDLTLSEHEVK